MLPNIVLQQGGAAIGFLFFIVFTVIFLAMVVWVYTDAEQNSDHPAFLWAIVVFLAPLLGLVLYFLLGRNARNSGF
ncbi:PLDc N-terminal domain-containing protein [Natronorubrum texcoconense]|uniref:Phospholipase_D-nuclease N-terminal n=1 Tax=Natronorubrum texcoconense TaxID=1095776 RepID=A0A1G8VLE9_9EURY|nr:PLDc N-terminal domain-containing protein [Natronorubrum texcoconense]SDJ66747.1 Phospholipase_D-nuclease N-terminal [Natronorubrum texcoconense]